jgi:hypothetical protein
MRLQGCVGLLFGGTPADLFPQIQELGENGSTLPIREGTQNCGLRRDHLQEVYSSATTEVIYNQQSNHAVT